MPASAKPYRLLEHTADIRVRITGQTLKDLLQNAVFTLTDTLVEATSAQKKISRKIRIKTETVDSLLIRLLQEILFFFDAKNFVTRRLEILKLRANSL
jgi:SHS2 domain-containing protein